MNRSHVSFLAIVFTMVTAAPLLANPIHVTYQWHMHQPIYYPYESVTDTDNNGRYIYSVRGVHDERFGNYNDYVKNAVQQGEDKGVPHSGVQVSFSGSLMENLIGIWGTGWREHWRWARNGLRTSMNNPRADMVGFAYHHSLMPLTCYESMRMQIKLHKEAYFDNWDTAEYSKGFFPPESAFASHMIPALVDEGIEWVFIDNGHFDRTFEDFTWSPASSIRPNKADIRNGSATERGSSWVQLNNVWAPTKVAAPISYQPHKIRYVDPNSDPNDIQVKEMVGVPAARYEGNENGRGGYGAFKPENVWGSHIDKNNDADHPMIIVCHSDGDNYGMKNPDVYHAQHGFFLDMVKANNDFDNTTVQDYLDMYGVQDGYFHPEPGTWIGIDGGTPYYDKWRENNAQNGEHPDFWSWSVIVAAQNRVIHADKLDNSYSMNDVRYNIGNDTAKAWHYYLQAEVSCHWYWDYDYANPWDGNATRGCNLAVGHANNVISAHGGSDPFGPSIFPPQRSHWNPGGKHWDEPETQPTDFDIWTFVDDYSGVQEVRLKWRVENFESYKNLNEFAHEIYAQTPGKNGAWNTVVMSGEWYPTSKGGNVPDAVARAKMYTGTIAGQDDVLIGYYVEATDNAGNVNKSIIQHVFVGDSDGGGNFDPYVEFDPAAPDSCDPVTIKYKKAGSPLGAGQVYIHVGHDDFQDTIVPNPAMTDSGDYWTYVYTPVPGTEEINVAFNNGAGSWDNNGGNDWKVNVSNCNGGGGTDPVVVLDPSQPKRCEPLVITYYPNQGPLSNTSPVSVYQVFNDAGGSPIQNEMAVFNDGWIFTNDAMAGYTNVTIWFAGSGGSPVDANGGSSYVYTVQACATNGPAAVDWSPENPDNCDPVTIRYKPNDGPLKGATPVYIHIGYNNWQGVIAPAPAMTLGVDGYWTYTYDVTPGTYEINMVFNDGAGTWDNNSDQDWTIDVTGCDMVDGVVITTPPADITVGAAQTAIGVDGVSGSGILGEMTWTNELTGGSGTFPAGISWDAGNIPLEQGANVIVITGTNGASGSVTNAMDDASNYGGGWSDGDNQGSGFSPWAMYADAMAGYEIGVDGFKLWSKTNNLVEAVRPFPSALGVGEVFKATFKNGWILEGKQGVGMALRAGDGTSLIQFFFNGGDAQYQVQDAEAARDCGVNWTDQPQDIQVQLTSSSNYILNVDGTIINGTFDGTIEQVRFWNWNGGDASNYDFFFDDLMLLSAGSGPGETFSDTVTVTRISGFVDTDNDGIDDDWEDFHFKNLTTANEHSDWDLDHVKDRDESKAGTDPKLANSYPRAAQIVTRVADGKCVLHWPSAHGRLYDVYRSSDLTGSGAVLIGSNLPYMPTMNVFTDDMSGADAQFYWIGVREE